MASSRRVRIGGESGRGGGVRGAILRMFSPVEQPEEHPVLYTNRGRDLAIICMQESITLKQRSVHAPEYHWRGWFTRQPRLLKIVPPK